MKPMMIIPPNTMSQSDIKLLRENDVCVVVAKNPANVRFVDPIPVLSSRTQMEHAAIQLSRRLLNGQMAFNDFGDTNRNKIANLYVQLLVEGTPLDRATKEEKEKEIYEEEKYDEIRRIARADAKAERENKKKEQTKDQPK